MAVLAFLVAEETGVNYFVAAFVAGFAFRAGTGEDDEEATELPELIGRVLALAVWFVFGAGLLLDGLEIVDWRIALYAVLSLTVVRMVPVAISMIGAGFSSPRHALHRVVRSAGSRLGGLRAPDRRGAPRRRPTGADRAVHHRPDRAAQRDRPRDQRPTTDHVDAGPRSDVRRARGGRDPARIPARRRDPRSQQLTDHGGHEMSHNSQEQHARRTTESSVNRSLRGHNFDEEEVVRVARPGRLATRRRRGVRLPRLSTGRGPCPPVIAKGSAGRTLPVLLLALSAALLVSCGDDD